MKSMKKLLAILLASILVFGLFACAKEDTPPVQTGPSTEPSINISEAPVTGKLIYSASISLTIDHEATGLVTSITNNNDEANLLIEDHEEFIGLSCAEVVEKLIATTVENSKLPQVIVLKQVPGSVLPTENFLNDLASKAQAKVDSLKATSTVITVSADKLDDFGYISAELAQEITLKYLGLEKATTFTGKNEPNQQGNYLFYLEEGELKAHYLVNATTGAVSQVYEDDPLLWEDESNVSNPEDEIAEDIVSTIPTNEIETPNVTEPSMPEDEE